MPEPSAPDAATSIAAAVSPARRKRLRWLPVGITLLLLATTVLASLGAWWRIGRPLQAQVARQARSIEEIQRRLASAEAWRSTTSDDLAALEHRLRQLNGRVEQLGPQSLIAWSLAQADHLLRSARHAAVADQDPARAALALGLANATLAAVPGSQSLRAALDQTRTALEHAPLPDIGALTGELSSAASALRAAPLRDPAAQATSPAGWRGALQAAWRRLDEVIVVQRVNAPIEPLLRPQEAQYLRQQLALKFTSADLALQRRNTEAFRSELADLQAWGNAYLDVAEPATAAALGRLVRLAALDLRPPLPDIAELELQLDALRRANAADPVP